jgi:ATP-dependent exoDNAse (exonuclease V) alpha subunit
MELSSQAQRAFEMIELGHRSVLVTGKAGTGKSSFIRYLMQNTKKGAVVCAPTGIAAINARGVTIHSFFQLPFGPLQPNDERLYHLRINPKKRKILSELELLVLDEISMIRADILDAIDTVLRLHSKQQDQPFGGKQIVLVGDPFQLEPVVTVQDRYSLGAIYRSFYFFHSKAFQRLSPPHIQFNEVYRQADAFFIKLLDQIRLSDIDEEGLEDINYQYQKKFEDKDLVILLSARRDVAERTNTERLNAIREVPQFFTGVIENQFPLTQLPTSQNLSLKSGAQVMFVKNDVEKRWVNGTLAKVTAMTKSNVTVETETGNLYDVKPELWENVEYGLNEEGKIKEEIKGKFIQLPLQLAWAVTIHKSQGLTFDKVEINLDQGAFAAGQLYVALSRCRTIDGISLQTKVKLTDVKTHPEVVAFVNGDLYFDE